MTTFKNAKDSKRVNIGFNEFNGFVACYVQVTNGIEQLLQMKSFASEGRAKGWANKMLA